MAQIHIPAARVRQGTLVLYATALKVRDLVPNTFYSVETLDPENPNDRGYQRLLNIARAKRLADYILKGQDTQDAFLPTSVFLATDKMIDFNEHDHTIIQCRRRPAPSRRLKDGGAKGRAGSRFRRTRQYSDQSPDDCANVSLLDREYDTEERR